MFQNRYLVHLLSIKREIRAMPFFLKKLQDFLIRAKKTPHVKKTLHCTATRRFIRKTPNYDQNKVFDT